MYCTKRQEVFVAFLSIASHQKKLSSVFVFIAIYDICDTIINKSYILIVIKDCAFKK